MDLEVPCSIQGGGTIKIKYLAEIDISSTWAGNHTAPALRDFIWVLNYR